MRKVTGEEKLMGTAPRSLNFQEPTGTSGFVSKEGIPTMKFSDSEKAHIVISQYVTADSKATDTLVARLSEIASGFEMDSDVLTYSILKRRDDVDTEITVFERYTSKDTYNRVVAEFNELMYVWRIQLSLTLKTYLLMVGL
jgi:hypothetical protein